MKVPTFMPAENLPRTAYSHFSVEFRDKKNKEIAIDPIFPYSDSYLFNLTLDMGEIQILVP